MFFAQRVFHLAGIYGLSVLLPQFFLEGRLGRDFPPAINHPEYFYGFIGVAAAWQTAFLIIARDPARYRLVMLPGILEKLSFGIAGIALFATGRLAATTMAFGIIDLAWAALFWIAFTKVAAVGDHWAPSGGQITNETTAKDAKSTKENRQT